MTLDVREAPDASIISIRAHYAHALVYGPKRVELRRQRPAMEPGHILYVYASGTVGMGGGAFIGMAEVREIEVRSVRALWHRLAKANPCMSRAEYLEYFAGCEQAVAVHLSAVRSLAVPLSLAEVRERSPLFQPPQTWRSVQSLPLPLQRQLELAHRGIRPLLQRAAL